MLEFFIALFGIPYLLYKYFQGKNEAMEKQARKERIDREYDYVSRKYKAPYEFIYEVDSLTRTNTAELRDRVKDSYDSILAANQYLRPSDIDKRFLRDLVFAEGGYIDSIHYRYQLDGDKYTIAGKIAFAREVERLLIAAGQKEARFVYLPGIGVDLYDDSKMYMGSLILKEYEDAFGNNERTRRLW